MEYRRSDSSGTDDDLLPSQPRRPSRGGHASGNEWTASGSRHHRHSLALDQYLRKLERDAYVGVLRAFRAQSAAITWRKEQVMVTLRQELGITDEEHLEIVRGMDSVNAPSQLRERDERVGSMYIPNVEAYPGATMHVSRKRPKSTRISQGHRWQTGSAVGARLPSLGDSSAGEGTTDPWKGKKVKTRWPDDNIFDESVITDHDLKKLPPSDLQFLDGPPVSSSQKGANLAIGSWGPPGRGTKSKRGGESSGILSSGGRGQSASKGPADSFERPAQDLPSRSQKAPMPENVSDKRAVKHIQFPTLDALIKQVDKIAEEDDLAKVESIRRTAREHEEMLRKALAEIGESSEEGGTDEDDSRPFVGGHPTEHEREKSTEHGRDQHKGGDEDNTAGDKQGSDGDQLAGDAS